MVRGDPDDEAAAQAAAARQRRELALARIPEGILADGARRSEPRTITAGLVTASLGMVALLGVPVLALPALCAGVTLVSLGSDARLLWSPRHAGVGGVAFGAAGALVAAYLGAPGGWLAVPIAGALAAGASGYLGRRDRRLIARLVAAHARGEELEARVDAILTLPRPVVFDAAALLTAWGRFDLLERLGTYAMVPGADGVRRYHLAVARLALGDPDSALAIADGVDRTTCGPAMAEEWTLLVALARIAIGEAAAVIAELGPCPIDEPIARARRQLVVAEARLALGEVAAARAIVLAVAGAHGGRELLVALKQSRRRCATIAAQLLDGDGPYR